MRSAVGCCMPVIGVLMGLVLAVTPINSNAEVRSTIVHYASAGPATADGYENAQIEVQYQLLNCSGSITLAVKRVKGSVKASQRYWFEKNQIPASTEPPHSPPVAFSGQVLHDGARVGRFGVQAGDSLGFGCYSGDTYVIDALTNHVGLNAKQEDIERFIAALTIRTDSVREPLQNDAIARVARAQREEANRKLQLAEQERQAQHKQGAQERKATEGSEKQREQTTNDYSGGNFWGTGATNTKNSGRTGENSNARFVRSTNGGYFFKAPDGQYKEISADEYHAGRARDADERMQSVQVEKRSRKVELKLVEQQRRQDYVDRTHQAVDQQIQNFAHSYYTAQAAGHARKNLNSLTKLNGNYSSSEELEADFQRRVLAMNQEVVKLEQASRQGVDAATNLYFADSDPAVEGFMNSLGQVMAKHERDKVKREANQNLEQQRQRLLHEIESKRIASTVEMRRTLIEQFPEGGVPLSSHNIDSNELYFFSYTYDHAAIKQPSPGLILANTFPVTRHGDGTWPYKQTIDGELQRIAQGKNTLVGFYASRELADSMRSSFIRLATQSGFQIREIEYKGKQLNGDSKNTEMAVTAEKSFWSTQKSQKKNYNNEEDFWK